MKLQQRLGLFDAIMIIAGSMIGSGIFFAQASIAGQIQAPGLLLGLWIFGGFFTIMGALSCAELAAMYPKAGGQYVFIREAFGSFWAFLFGWTQFLVVQTGFIAAVSIAFAKSLGYFCPQVGEDQILFHLPLADYLPFLHQSWVPASLQHLKLNSAQSVACLVIMILTAINIRGIREGAFVQNLFTVAKIGALCVLAVVGIYQAANHTDRFFPLVSMELGTVALAKNISFAAAFAVALSQALFAYDAWNTVTFVAEEVRDPNRTLPRALFLGTFLVMIVYFFTIVCYLATIPAVEMPNIPEQRIGQAVAQIIFGPVGATMIVSAILISAFGCVNGLILSGARVNYAMAREGLFFSSCAQLHATRATPVPALILQAIWACVLTVSGSFSALLTYTTFASVLFAVLMVMAVFRLRSVQPNAERPYRCWAYPLPPLVYLAIAIPFLVYVIQGDPMSTGIGLLLVLSGVPAYLFWRRQFS